MELKRVFGLLALVVLLLSSPAALADQRRDWMVDVQPGGTYLNVDTVFPGAQLLLEHRIPVHGKQNELDFRLNSLFTLPFYESQFDVDLRVLVVTVGGGLGYRDTFRNQTFAEEEPLTREHRRDREYSGDFDVEDWWFAEGRLNLSIPINDHVVFHNLGTLRHENRPDRSFDWRTGVVHDGSFLKSEHMLFVKHRVFGAFAPMIQFLDFDLGDERHALFNYGFFFVTRPGFRRRDDIFLLTMLFFGDTLGGMDADDIYGFHVFFAPMTFTLAYRMVFDLQG